MNVVLDVSAAIEVALRKPRAKAVQEIIEKADWTSAPDIFVPVAANTAWKAHMIGGVPIEDCLNAYRDAVEFVDHIHDSSDLAEESIDMACRTRMPVYDSLYITLARRLAAQLVTLDKRLAKAAIAQSVRVVEGLG